MRSSRAALALGLVIGASPQLAKAAPTAPAAKMAPLSASEQARLSRFVDKDGGYRDKAGGYFNPKAGTYADAKGGVVDNWQGYTYADGSYKSAVGDYFDAPKNRVSLANGETVDPKGAAPAEVIRALRETVEENGGYDKEYIRKGMMDEIAREHPLRP